MQNLEKQVIDWKALGGSFSKFMLKVAPVWLDLVTQGLASPIATTIEEGAKLFDYKKKAITTDTLYGEYKKVIEQLVKNNSIIIIIEDLQWADANSINLLFYLMRNIEKGKLLVIATYRPVEALELSPNAETLRTVKVNLELNSQLAQTINLTTGLAVQDYVKKRYGEAVIPDSMLGRIQTTTEGHPFFIAELFNLWEQNGDLVKQEGEWRLVSQDPPIEIPDGLKGLILERVRKLNEQLRNILKGASVEGEDFTAQTIANLYAIEEMKLYDEIALLAKRYNFVYNTEISLQISDIYFDFYRFVHKFIQQTIYDDLDSGQRRLLHRNVARVLERLCEDKQQIASQLARHYIEANLKKEALPYVLMSAKNEQAKFSWTESLTWCERGLILLDELNTPALDHLRVDFLELSGLAYYYRGDYKIAAKNYEASIDLGVRLNIDPNHIVGLYAAMADSYQIFDDYESSTKMIANANQLIQEKQLPDSLETMSLRMIEGYNVLFGDGDLDKGIKKFEEALSISENLEQNNEVLDVVSSIYNGFGVGYSLKGQYSISTPYFQKAADISEQIGNTTIELLHITNLIDDYVVSREKTDLADLFEKAEELAARVEDKDGIAYLKLEKGSWLLSIGKLDEAEICLRDTIDVYKRLEIESSAAYAYGDLGLVHLERQDLEQALYYANRALDVSKTTMSKGHARRVLGQISTAQGEYDSALTYFESSIQYYEKDDYEHLAAVVKRDFAKALIQFGEHQRAQKLLEEAMGKFQELNLAVDLGETKQLLEDLEKQSSGSKE